MEKKLTLKKETLKTLSVELLCKVAGGLANQAPDQTLSANGSVVSCNAL